jgi:hypothetical protein
MGRASDHDEGFTVCTDCGYRRREVVIRDQFLIAELIDWHNGCPLPVKFLLYSVNDDQFILELED